MLRFLWLSIGVVLLSQCTSTRTLNRATAEAQKSWNDGGFWKPLPGSPSAYLPRDISPKLALKAAASEWVTAQDGARFYAPAQGTPHYSPGIVRGEVSKATNPKALRERKLTTIGKVLLVPVGLVTLKWLVDESSAPRLRSQSGGGSGAVADVDTSSVSDTSTTTNDSKCDSDHKHNHDCQDHGGDHCKR